MILRVPPWISQHRVDRLFHYLCERLPTGGAWSVLDVGCGHARITKRLQERFPACRFSGVDVVVREGSSIPVVHYDGERLPFPDRSFDVVLLIDVVHHASKPRDLLKECARVARSIVLIKDHVCESWYDWVRLAWMDWFGNRSFGIPMTYEYFTRRQWEEAFEYAELRCRRFDVDIRTCPRPVDVLLDSGVQVIAVLEPVSTTPSG